MTSLLLGAFEMLATDGSTRVMADGTSWGEPVPIEVVINSFLQDGAIVVTQGHDNREVTVRVRFYGNDLAALNAKEAALIAETEKPNTLTWTPPDGAPATVFVVVTSKFGQEDESFVGEVQDKPWRTYNIRLTCEAFTRSATETVTAALPATGTTTTSLDTCSATTGWTGTIDGGAVSVATAGGMVSVSAAATKGSHSYSMSKTFAATTTALKLLQVDWQRPAGAIDPTDSTTSRFRATGDGVALELVAEVPSPTSGLTRTYFRVAAASLGVTKFDWSGYFPVAQASAGLYIDNVAVTDVNPIAGNPRQQMRSIFVGGSAPAPGNLIISSAFVSSLGDAIVYVFKADATTSGYWPAMRTNFRTSGNTVTTSSSMVSGASEPLDTSTAVVFDVPIGSFPRGRYLLMARLATSGGGTPTISYQTSTMISGNIRSQTGGTRQVTTTTAYQNFVLGSLQLPTLDLDLAIGGFATMRLVLLTSSTCSIDEAWLFNVDIGAIVQVDCGTGTSLSGTANQRLLSIQSPTITTPRPVVRIGSVDSLVDSYFPAGKVTSWDFPRFTPPQVNVFYVTPGATDAGASLTYYKHWHTNAGS